MTWFRRRRDVDEVRPRFGHLDGPNGEHVPLVFHPHPRHRGVYVGKVAGDEQVARIADGWTLSVDVIGAGQSIELEAEFES
jgi:hypothetical protein